MSNSPPEPTKYKSGLFHRALGFIGIRSPLEKRQGLVLTRRFGWFLLCLIVLLAAAVAWFALYYSNQPSFCGSCHLMKPYVASWQASKHHTAKCYRCHIPQGLQGLVAAKTNGLVQVIKDITGRYGTPRAEIEDAACLQEGCHKTSDLKRNILFRGKYNFDHVSHLTALPRGKKLGCVSCHSQLSKEGEHFTVLESTCIICHFKGEVGARTLEPVAGCTACHSPPREPIKTSTGLAFDHGPFLERGVACEKCHFDTVRGTGEVSRQVCQTCHVEQDKLKKLSDPAFLHDWHVTRHKIKCFQCHSDIRHGLNLQPAAHLRCETCHAGEHAAHRQLLAGKGGLGLPDGPSKHFLASVACVACHQTADGQHDGHAIDTVTFKTTAEACVKCHGPAMKNILAGWKESLRESLAEGKAKVDKASKAVSAMAKDHSQASRAGKLLEAAVHNCLLVEQASGVHNIDYAMALLEQAGKDADQAFELANSQTTTAPTQTAATQPSSSP